MKSISSDQEHRPQWKLNFIFGLAILLIMYLAIHPDFIYNITSFKLERLAAFKTMFVSIVLEALPFIILSVIISSIVHVLLPEGFFQKIVPRTLILGILTACFIGLLFPVCECGLIPIVRRFVSKGMPLYFGIVFILVGPVINPIVYSATYTAFQTKPEMLYARMSLALVVGIVVGLFIHFYVKQNPLKSSSNPSSVVMNEETELGKVQEHPHHHHHRNKVQEIMNHAGMELFSMGSYLILGSLVAAVIQSVLPRSQLADMGQGDLGSSLLMMGLAFILSLCSTSDAFVASSFVNTFSSSSILAFLVLGPMINLKGTIMLLSTFNSKFVLLLSLLVSIIILVGSIFIGKIFLW